MFVNTYYAAITGESALTKVMQIYNVLNQITILNILNERLYKFSNNNNTFKIYNVVEFVLAILLKKNVT